jgi:hypothetical protein
MTRFGFEGFRSGDRLKSAEELKPCTHPDGHLWEKSMVVLLSNPPQNVYHCVREGCGQTRNVLQRRPKPRLLRDEELPK